MPEHGQAIADAIVVAVKEQPEGTFDFKFEIEAPEDPQQKIDFEGERRHDGLRVFVAPVSKEISRIDRGGTVQVNPTINIFVSKFISEGGPGRKALSHFVDQLERSLRTEMAGACWGSSEIITLYDPIRLRTQDRFFSVIGLTFFDVDTT